MNKESGKSGKTTTAAATASETRVRRGLRAMADGLYRRLSRVTTSGEFIAEVDGLRFLAIAPVVIFHLRNYLTVHPVAAYAVPPDADWAARLTVHGHYGVHLFFVISGFVLALPFVKHHLRGAKPVRLRHYYLRRLTRLEPPYVLVMLGLFALLLLSKGMSASLLWPHLAAGLTYTHGLVFNELNPINIVAWSLEVEVQFYLLMPLLAFVFAVRRTSPRRMLIIAAAIVCVLTQAWFIADGPLRWSLLNYLQYFLAGFLLADLYVHEPGLQRPGSLAWDFVAAAALPLMWLAAERPVLARAAFAPLAFLFFCASFRGRLLNQLLTRRPVTVIGGMCYTIYLVHLALISAFEKTFGHVSLTSYFSVNLLLHVLLFTPLLLLCCAAFFVLVERPCMRRDWPRRLWRRIGATVTRRPMTTDPAFGRNLAE